MCYLCVYVWVFFVSESYGVILGVNLQILGVNLEIATARVASNLKDTTSWISVWLIALHKVKSMEIASYLAETVLIATFGTVIFFPVVTSLATSAESASSGVFLGKWIDVKRQSLNMLKFQYMTGKARLKRSLSGHWMINEGH